MTAQEFFYQIDVLYESDPERVESFLQEQRTIGESKQDLGRQLMVLNELIGYYRSRSLHQASIDHSFMAIRLLGDAGLLQHVQGATTLLNCATAFKAADCFEEAKLLYERCLKIYEDELEQKDERFASLYNNMSDLYGQFGDTLKAKEYLFKAIEIMNKDIYPIEWATSMTNLGGLYLKEGDLKQATSVLTQAQTIFSKTEDPHLGVCLLYLGKIKQSIEDYEHGLALIRHYFKENDEFRAGWKEYLELLKQKGRMDRYHLAQKKTIKGMELSQGYYEEVGKPILEKTFPDLFKQMTIALIGMGSECYGMDDAISQDHDFYPRFLIFVEDDMDPELIAQIQAVYDQLPDYYLGYRKTHSRYKEKRDGVFKIQTFFREMLGSHFTLEDTLDWFYLDEAALSMVQNGKIFKEGENTFNEWRHRLYYYSEDVRLKKIMSSLAKMAQSGQYNYSRMMKRGDLVAANQALSQFIEETLKVLFLLHRQYCPYYKWRFALAKQLFDKEPILDQLETLVQAPFVPLLYKEAEKNGKQIGESKEKWIEEISHTIIKALKRQHLTDHDDSFLQNHLENIRTRISDPEIKAMHVMEG
ncbi:DUF4037 domain-containing protein [Beduini massiliensis]|uniref:DUF4037 domain-containing protein n=1 Tax=Beduini massiliensis TaxID=1585974 RepID=UPI00059AA8D7|nr:DUF4037 domain-containing protein [Beduini massiliensis]